jgi:RHS repeat-associated protein
VTHNANNEQLTFSAQSLVYDLNGNLTSDGTNTYTWDARNRLAAVAGPLSASFVYDAAGRRSRKTINGTSTDFVYDTLNPVQEQSGSTITNLLTGLGMDEYFSRGDATATAFFLTDALGSTVALADSSGSTPTSYTYEPFGTTGTTGSPTSNPYDFTGRESDLTSLKYYRMRYYHAVLSRFLSEDPTRFTGGDVNLYAYVNGNPIFYSDPLGLWQLAPGVPYPKNEKITLLLTNLENCLGEEIYVTSTHEPYGRPPGNAHLRGDAFDMRYPSDAARALCCAARYGAANARDELKHPVPHMKGPNIHVSIVPGFATNPGGPRGDLPPNTCGCQ